MSTYFANFCKIFFRSAKIQNLVLKVKEQTVENMMKGRKIYEPPRFMSTQQACAQLMAIVKRRRSKGEEVSLGKITLMTFRNQSIRLKRQYEKAKIVGKKPKIKMLAFSAVLDFSNCFFAFFLCS